MRDLRLDVGCAALKAAQLCIRVAQVCYGPAPRPVPEPPDPGFYTVYRNSPDGPEPEAILKKEQP